MNYEREDTNARYRLIWLWLLTGILYGGLVGHWIPSWEFRDRYFMMSAGLQYDIYVLVYTPIGAVIGATLGAIAGAKLAHRGFECWRQFAYIPLLLFLISGVLNRIISGPAVF